MDHLLKRQGGKGRIPGPIDIRDDPLRVIYGRFSGARHSFEMESRDIDPGQPGQG